MRFSAGFLLLAEGGSEANANGEFGSGPAGRFVGGVHGVVSLRWCFILKGTPDVLEASVVMVRGLWRE